MAVSRENKEYWVAVKAAEVAQMLSSEFGNTVNYWLIELQSSELYRGMLELRSALWSEGTMYLHFAAIMEFHLQGGRMLEVVPKINPVVYIQSAIILALHKNCGLSQAEVTSILRNTDLVEYLENMYEIFHCEGLYANLERVKEHLSTNYGVKIKIRR